MRRARGQPRGMHLVVLAALVLAFAGLTVPATASVVATPAEGTPTPRPTTSPSEYIPPLVVLELVRGFEAPRERWGAGHRGVDLAAATGQPVRAPGPGTVTFAGRVAGRGVVTVAHPDGLRSSLEPVEARVVAGEQVTAGQELGEIESPEGHCAPQACLHWGVRDGATYLDPLRLLAGGPSVLLPGP